MRNPVHKTRQDKEARFAAWMMIVYIVTIFVVRGWERVLTHMDVFVFIPHLLFTVYLLFIYRRNRHNLLMPNAFTQAALSTVLLLDTSVSNLIVDNGAAMIHITDVGTVHINARDTYLLSLVDALICFVAYTLFAVDGFCKFRLRKVSRIVSVAMLWGMVVLECVRGMLRYGWSNPLFLIELFCDLLLYGSFAVFFSGAAQKDARIRRTPCHDTVSDRMVMNAPTPTRFCGHCGSPVQGDVCPNCGARNE